MRKDLKVYSVIAVVAIILFLLTTYQMQLLNIQDKEDLILIVVILLAITINIILLAISIYKEKDMNDMKLFKTIMPIIFILFFICMPALKSHDEDAHWFRIYDISQGNLLTSCKYNYVFEQEGNYPVGKFPKAVFDLREKIYVEGESVTELLNLEINENEAIYIAMPTTAIYSPIQYMPQALGVFIANIFTNKPIIMYYVARLFNALLTVGLIYLAIKFMPFGKKAILIVASIPIALEGCLSLSPDAMTIAMCLLFTAYIFYLKFNDSKTSITLEDKIIIALLGSIVALCKIVYLPIVGLVLLLPKNKFKSKKEQITTMALVILIAVIINLTWLSIAGQYLAEYKEGMPVNQVQTLLKNPIEYIKVLLYSMDLNGSKYLLSMFGGEIGLNECLLLHSVVPYTFIFLTMIIALFDESIKNKFDKYSCIIMALIVLAVIGLVFTSLYIQWTNEESTSIRGVQGRYFLPILPLIIMLLSKIKVSTKYTQENITKFIGICILLIQINILPLVFCIRCL